MFAFTFQYVSINTTYDDDHIKRGSTLHSNMFLLILAVTSKLADQIFFTFQYVSINTKKHLKKLRQHRKLYIPICFY